MTDHNVQETLRICDRAYIIAEGRIFRKGSPDQLAADPKVKVVLISGYSFTEEARRISEEGAAALLLKPIPAKELLQTIADVLGVQDTT